MGKEQWTGRRRAAIGMARAASGAEARLIRYEPAGRYGGIPFLLRHKEAATQGERAALDPPEWPAAPTGGGPSGRGR